VRTKQKYISMSHSVNKQVVIQHIYLLHKSTLVDWCKRTIYYVYAYGGPKTVFGPPGVTFINVLHSALTLVDPESVKNTVKSLVPFYTFGICRGKSCS